MVDVKQGSSDFITKGCRWRIIHILKKLLACDKERKQETRCSTHSASVVEEYYCSSELEN